MFGAVLRAMMVLGAAVAFAGSALAQTTPAATGEKASARTGGKRKVIEMDPLEVIGKVQKPHVFYVIERGDLKYRGLPIERSLLKEVEESVKRPPF
ncbi:MAG: hypothetical protein FJ087_19250 [Deltaproteobacteria bacterium]|nr:hypothetical protein [Deltaproteobacteria bacterium]